MIVRRRFILAFNFLAFAVLLSSAGAARAQRSNPSSPGQHEALPGPLTSDQVKAALERFSRSGGPDLPPELLDQLKKHMERDGKKIDEKQLKSALEMMQANPELRKQVEEMGRSFRNSGGKNRLTQEERQQFEKLAPQIERMLPPNGGPPPFANPMPGALPPLPGKDDPPVVPKNFDPKLPNGPPMPPPNLPMPNPNPLPKIEPKSTNPLDPNESPRDKAAHAAASLWERNIGPLDETPAVKRALFDLVEGTDDIRDSDGKSFWDSLSLEKGESTPLADLLDGAALGESWTLPKFDLSSLRWGGSDRDTDVGAGSSSSKESWWKRLLGDRKPSTPSSPRTPSSGSSGFNIGIPGLEGSWVPVVLLAVLLFGSLLVWRFWGWKSSRAARGFGLGGPGWPIDPRRITTREHVVLAFEYLSVMICGPTAKTWTHNTIAEALTELAATHGETAVMLARLYELARYAPLDEPLTTAELAEARRLVCSLAGLELE